MNGIHRTTYSRWPGASSRLLAGTSPLGTQDIDRLHGMPKMWNYDTATNDQRNVERVVQLVISPALADRLLQMVIDTVITAQNGRGDQAEQFLGLAIQCL